MDSSNTSSDESIVWFIKNGDPSFSDPEDVSVFCVNTLIIAI